MWEGSLIAPRASFGIQPYGPDDDHLSLITRADSAMYEVKRARRLDAGKEAAA
jgi:GGDEF domain-containing protein